MCMSLNKNILKENVPDPLIGERKKGKEKRKKNVGMSISEMT